MHSRKVLIPISALTSLALMTGSTGAVAQGSIDSIAEAIKSGSHKLSFRLRHESVDQENPLSDADATTLRTRLTLTSGEVSGFTGLLEFDNVSTIGSDSYDSFVLDQYRGNHSIIADPVGTEINQASLSYKIDEEQTLVAGRQRINHAAQRFVGGVGWRQNEQTYDALSYKFKNDAIEVDYSYLWNVNRIFNSSKASAQRGNLNSDSHILLGSYSPDWGKLSGYVYALEFDDVAGLSSITYGLSYAGKVGPVALNAAVASQSDYGNSMLDYDASYFSVDGSIMAGPVKLLAGYEVLGSDSGVASFKTPLATLHKWQGWTDLFLATPANGVEDMFFTVSGKAGDVSLAATYHNLEAEEGGADYGSEWDLSASYAFNSVINAQLKYATFSSDGYAVDTDKLWLTLAMNF